VPVHLSGALFKDATPVRLHVDQILFHAGDAGDGCYRVDDGLLKVTMLSPSGNERILCFLGPRAVVGELSMIDGLRFLPREGPLACTLLELAGNFGQDIGSGRTVIREKIGQSDLAAMAGIARESASRIINDWQRRKMISRFSGYYCIENKDQLQHEAKLSSYPQK
jgi:CRP/FNR family transcriptional regulator, cyclic AMP receptor protein